jgi:hypothetical protein
MPSDPTDASQFISSPDRTASPDRWHTFAEILQRLHRERIYIHPDQLAAFFLFHGLPVDLNYVPEHLQEKAKQINANYRGDLAQLEEVPDLAQLFPFE